MKKPALSFAALRAANSARVRLFKGCEIDADGRTSWSLTDWMNALSGEVGEVMELLYKARHETTFPAALREELSHEIGDCQTYLDILSWQLDMTLADVTCAVLRQGYFDPLPERDWETEGLTALGQLAATLVRNAGQAPDSFQNNGLALSWRSGALADLLKKVRRGDFAPHDAALHQKLAEHVGQTQIALMLLAHGLDIDLGAATRIKFNMVSQKRGLNVTL